MDNRQSPSLPKGKPMLLIMRILSTALLMWAMSYVYILSSGRIQDVGMENVWSKGKQKKAELLEKLTFAEKLGSLEDCMIARTNWMLFLLKLNVVDESVKQAELLEKDLGRIKTVSIEEKIGYLEEIAVVYRSAGKFDQIDLLYRKLVTEIESSKNPNKESLLARVRNNMVVSQFFRGLSTHAPSKDGFKKRIKTFEEARQAMLALSKEVDRSAPDANNTKYGTSVEASKIIADNLSEINLEMEYALLRKKEYDR